jgi:hypothetical protein
MPSRGTFVPSREHRWVVAPGKTMILCPKRPFTSPATSRFAFMLR